MRARGAALKCHDASGRVDVGAFADWAWGTGLGMGLAHDQVAGRDASAEADEDSSECCSGSDACGGGARASDRSGDSGAESSTAHTHSLARARGEQRAGAAAACPTRSQSISGAGAVESGANSGSSGPRERQEGRPLSARGQARACDPGGGEEEGRSKRVRVSPPTGSDGGKNARATLPRVPRALALLPAENQRQKEATAPPRACDAWQTVREREGEAHTGDTERAG